MLPPPHIYVTPNATDAYTKDNNVRLFISDDYRTSTGEVVINSANIIAEYYFDRATQNGKGLFAYVYLNGSWNELLRGMVIAYDFGYSELGVSTGGQQVINPNTNNIQLYLTNSYGVSLCFQQAIDFSKYSTCEITITGGDSTSNLSHDIYVMNSSVPTSTVGNVPSHYKYSEITSAQKVSLAGVSEVSPKTVTIDISSLNGSGYLGIIDIFSKLTYTTTNISKIIMY